MSFPFKPSIVSPKVRKCLSPIQTLAAQTPDFCLPIYFQTHPSPVIFITATIGMHGSASLRSRQRTLTSCTECRRRKQKCNQTKDRPCSNCARRYPPVACTYLSHESSSAKVSRRGSPAEHVHGADHGRTTPKMDEQMVASEQVQRGSHSPYGSLSNAAEYPALPLEQSTYPSSPDIYYSSLQSVNYNQQSQYSTSPTYYPPTTNGAYLPSQQAPAAAGGQQSYSSYYPPVPTTQADWSPSNTESREFIGLSSSYETMSGLPLEPSSLNPDLFQFFGPLPHARWRRTANMAWGVDPMDRSKPIDIPPFLGRHSAGPLEGCAEEGLKAWQPTLLCAAKSF